MNKTAVLIEEEGDLVINHTSEVKNDFNGRQRRRLYKKIKEATKENKERVEIEIDEDGFKRFKGMIFIPKKRKSNDRKIP